MGISTVVRGKLLGGECVWTVVPLGSDSGGMISCRLKKSDSRQGWTRLDTSAKRQGNDRVLVQATRVIQLFHAGAFARMDHLYLGEDSIVLPKAAIYIVSIYLMWKMPKVAQNYHTAIV